MRDPQLPLVFTRGQAIRTGLTEHAVAWRLKTGRWRVVRRGVFTDAKVWETATAEQRHLLHALAGVLVCVDLGIVSHLTAALAYGWASPIDLDDTPWSTIAPGVGAPTRRRDHQVRQVAPLPEHHIDHWRGLALTSPARTVADCLRHFPAEVSVPIADSALARGVDPAAVDAVLRWQETWPYAARGLTSAKLLDGRREGWLESRSVVSMHRVAIPMPEPQVTILDERGRFVARVDFAWLDRGVVGEADGWAKYELPSPTGVGGPDGPISLANLRAEKTREDALRSLGYEVARWTTTQALVPSSGLGVQLSRAFSRADPTRVRGSVRRSTWPPVGQRVEAVGLQTLAALGGQGALIDPRSYSRYDGDLAS